MRMIKLTKVSGLPLVLNVDAIGGATTFKRGENRVWEREREGEEPWDVMETPEQILAMCNGSKPESAHFEVRSDGVFNLPGYQSPGVAAMQNVLLQLRLRVDNLEKQLNLHVVNSSAGRTELENQIKDLEDGREKLRSAIIAEQDDFGKRLKALEGK